MGLTPGLINGIRDFWSGRPQKSALILFYLMKPLLIQEPIKGLFYYHSHSLFIYMTCTNNIVFSPQVFHFLDSLWKFSFKNRATYDKMNWLIPSTTQLVRDSYLLGCWEAFNLAKTFCKEYMSACLKASLCSASGVVTTATK